MNALEDLFNRIVQRVNINLREFDYDVGPFIKNLVPLSQMVKFYAFYGITPHHPLNFEFRHSNLAGSYFLGKCRTNNSILYKSDVRGDELKKKGDRFKFKDVEIRLLEDEGIEIEDSYLIKTLIHNYSHDPETPERFCITNTVSAHYANIHGSPTNGSFLGAFSTVDLTTVTDCVVGEYSYIQAGEVGHLETNPGTVWVRSPGTFNFLYRYPQKELSPYLRCLRGKSPQGILMDFAEARKEAFQEIFNVVDAEPIATIPKTASVDRFAVVDGKSRIGENVLVAERAYLENAWLGKGSNAQENCHIVNARLKGNNVTAHGAKIIEADLGKDVFVGFNSFLRGSPKGRLAIGKESIVMPHTIIDTKKPLKIPAGHLVWGLVTDQAGLEENSVSLKVLSRVKDKLNRGDMYFEGSGSEFVTAFRNRIHHILEANGAFYDGKRHEGHAQKNQNISFNTIQPYPDGELEGLYPSILIQP
jgi:carbonic anhydrase/acetyltransferase-like protein (isoleucine patch superfamily)